MSIIETTLMQTRVLAKQGDLQAQLQDMAEHTAKSIEADLLCLPEAVQQAIIQQTGVVLHKKPKDQSESHSISALWAAELLIIKHLPYSDLIARLWIVREKFYSLVREDAYKNYLASLPNELSDNNLKLLLLNHSSASVASAGVALNPVELEAAIRSDALNLVRQIQRLTYYKALRLNSIYGTKKLTLNVTFAVLFLTLIASYLLFGEPKWDCVKPMQDYAIPIATVFAGMIGSCMSLLQRTEKASTAPSQFNDSVLDAMDIQLSMSLRYITSLVISGGIFAGLIYLLAVSGIVKDIIPFLPKFTAQDELKQPLITNALNAVFDLKQPERITQYALMMIWGFMAGFAERLVPDTLDSIMNKAKIKKD